jgi:hypothetical protein
LSRVLSFFLTLGFVLIGSVSSHADVAVTTTSSKGWSKTEIFNNLGLATNSTLSGAGIPTSSLSPAWRADGSLEGVSVNDRIDFSGESLPRNNL